MELREALSISSRGMATAFFSIVETGLFQGRVEAMQCRDGQVFLAEVRPDGRARLGDMRPLVDIPEVYRRVIESHDKWKAHAPRHPLEALASSIDGPDTIENLFHRIWGRSVEHEDYCEEDWRTLQTFISAKGADTALTAQFKDSDEPS